MKAQSPIDLNLLAEILGTNEEDELSEWLFLFLDHFPHMLPPLESAIESRQPMDLRNAAHKAKSTSSSIAAPRLTTLLRYLEVEASSEAWDAFSEAMKEVKSEFDLIGQFCRNR